MIFVLLVSLLLLPVYLQTVSNKLRVMPFAGMYIEDVSRQTCLFILFANGLKQVTCDAMYLHVDEIC